MDEEVHGLVWHALPPLNTRKRSDDEFIPNGSAIGDWNENNSLAQKQDIAERGMIPHWEHPFVADQNVVMPTANPWTRPYLPWAANGGSNEYAQVEAAPMKDIANKEVRPDVWVEVHKHVNPIAWGRYREPREVDEPVDRSWDEGPKEKEAPEPEFKFKKPEEKDEDAEKEKREAAAAENKEKAKEEKAAKDAEATKSDPEDMAAKVESAGKLEKSKEEVAKEKKEAEKEKLEKAADKKAEEAAEKEEKAVDAAKEKTEKNKKALETPKEEAKEAALAQVKSVKKDEGEKKEGEGEEKPKIGEPEKVHVLDPVDFKDKADTNAPTARTTFYAK